MVPLLLRHLGAETYGLYAALTAVAGYFALLTFGSTLSVPRFVAEHAARGETDALGEFVSTYLVAHLVVALAGFGAALGLAPTLQRVLEVPDALRPMVAPALRLVAAGWALGLTAGLWQSLLTGLGEVHLANLANSVRTLLNLAAVAAMVLVGGGLEDVLVALMAASLAGALGLAIFVRRRHPDIPIAPGRARLATLRATLRPAAFYFLMQVSALVVMGTDNIVISVFLGVGAVAAYAVAFQLWAAALAVLWSGVDVLMPFFTRWHATGEVETLRRSYLLAAKAAFGASALAALVLACFGTSLIRWWVGPTLFVEPELLRVFAAMFLTATPIHVASLLLAALGRHQAPAVGGTIEAALNLALSILLVRQLGVLGVALGTFLSGLLTNTWIAPGAACRVLGIARRTYLARAIAPAILPTLVAGAIAAWFARHAAVGSGVALGGLALTIALYAALFWMASLSIEERLRARTLVR